MGLSTNVVTSRAARKRAPFSFRSPEDGGLRGTALLGGAREGPAANRPWGSLAGGCPAHADDKQDTGPRGRLISGTFPLFCAQVRAQEGVGEGEASLRPWEEAL